MVQERGTGDIKLAGDEMGVTSLVAPCQLGGSVGCPGLGSVMVCGGVVSSSPGVWRLGVLVRRVPCDLGKVRRVSVKLSAGSIDPGAGLVHPYRGLPSVRPRACWSEPLLTN